MCLTVNPDLLNKLTFDQNGHTKVFKFMIQDPEGNLWSPKFGGKVQLDQNGFYHSDRKEKELDHTERRTHMVDHGIHTFAFHSAIDYVQRIIKYFPARLISKWGRPKGSKFVCVLFEASKEDLIATGEMYLVDHEASAVFQKVKFLQVLEDLTQAESDKYPLQGLDNESST